MTILKSCFVIGLALLGLAGCSASTSSQPNTAGSGGTSISGGAPAGGTGGSASGGSSSASGGSSSTGTGGRGTSGGAPTGGAGGTSSSGGAAGQTSTGTGGGAAAGAGGSSPRTDAGVDAAGGAGGADANRDSGTAGALDAGRDSSAGRDATADSTADGSASADGGAALQPYKGVANSTCIEMTILKTTWYYNWGTTPDEPSCTVGEYVPMIWGHAGNDQSATGITNTIKTLVTAGRKEVLGFNEPDNTTQSNIPVATAISLWPSFNNPAIRIGSPATQANTTGTAWFNSFMSQVNADTTGKLRVDFIAVHWYGWNAGSCEATASTLESYIRQIEAIPGNRPIWITEWGCMNLSNPTLATVQAFYVGAMAMFARHPRIERYAWYPWNTNNELFSVRPPATPVLSSLGTVFVSEPQYK
jgi:hypothetical protein